MITRTELLTWFYRRARRYSADKENHLREIKLAFGNTEDVYRALDGLVELGAIWKTRNTYEVSEKWRRGLGVSGQSHALGVSRDRLYRSSELASSNGTRESVRIADGLWSSMPPRSGPTASIEHI